MKKYITYTSRTIFCLTFIPILIIFLIIFLCHLLYDIITKGENAIENTNKENKFDILLNKYHQFMMNPFPEKKEKEVEWICYKNSCFSEQCFECLITQNREKNGSKN